MFSFKPAFPLSSFTLIKRLFSSSLISAIRVVSSAYLRLMFLPAILIPLSFHYLLEFAQTHVHAVSDTIQPSDSLSSPSPPAFNLSQHQGRSSESALPIRWPKYWSFSFSISPSNEYSGLISFRIDWFDLPAVQGPLKSLLQHHSWKTSVLWRSAFFMVQLSRWYLATGKTIASTIQTFV